MRAILSGCCLFSRACSALLTSSGWEASARVLRTSVRARFASECRIHLPQVSSSFVLVLIALFLLSQSQGWYLARSFGSLTLGTHSAGQRAGFWPVLDSLDCSFPCQLEWLLDSRELCRSRESNCCAVACVEPCGYESCSCARVLVLFT